MKEVRELVDEAINQHLKMWQYGNVDSDEEQPEA